MGTDRSAAHPSAVHQPFGEGIGGAERSEWQPRYTLGGMFLIMFLLSCVFAGGHYAYQAVRGAMGSKLVLILAVLAGPMLIMIVFSAGYTLLNRGRAHRAKRVTKKS